MIPITIEGISIGSIQWERFDVQIGVMDSGFDINRILGMDFLSAVGAVIVLNSRDYELNDVLKKYTSDQVEMYSVPVYVYVT